MFLKKKNTLEKKNAAISWGPGIWKFEPPTWGWGLKPKDLHVLRLWPDQRAHAVPPLQVHLCGGTGCGRVRDGKSVLGNHETIMKPSWNHHETMMKPLNTSNTYVSDEGLRELPSAAGLFGICGFVRLASNLWNICSICMFRCPKIHH